MNMCGCLDNEKEFEQIPRKKPDGLRYDLVSCFPSNMKTMRSCDLILSIPSRILSYVRVLLSIILAHIERKNDLIDRMTDWLQRPCSCSLVILN
jgi:hypothetical protein